MDELRVKGFFKEAVGKLKSKYAQLTDDDVAYEDGKEDELIGRLQTKLGKSKDEVRALLYQGDEGFIY